MNLGKPVKHLLVDLDGTVVGNRPVALSVDFARRALRAMKPYGGLRKSAKILIEINKEFGRASKDITNDIRVVELFSRRLKISPEDARKILRENLLILFPYLEKHFYPMPGAKEFLMWAKEHYPLTLATNPVWPLEVIELRVKWAGVDPKIFSNITHVRQMTACKPAREYYEGILKQENLNPDDCLLIGNDVKMDLPASKCGIRVYIVSRAKRMTALKASPANPKSAAQAWRGSFACLQKALKEQISSS